MPLTGHLTYASGTFAHNFGNYLFCVGADGKHYVVQQDTGYVARVGQAESNNQVFGLSLADWRADVAGNVGGIGGVPDWTTTVIAPGTPYFFVGGFWFNHDGIGHVVFLRYKITDDMTIGLDTDPDIIYQASNSGGGDLWPTDAFMYPRGAAVIGGRLYFVTNSVKYAFGLPVYSTLVDLPMSGAESELTSGAWGNHSKLLGLPWYWLDNVIVPDGRLLQNKIAVFDAGSGVVGVVLCQDAGDSYGPLLLGLTVTAGAASSTTDLSSGFSWPFADTATKYDGTASSNSRDRWTLSNILPDGSAFEFLFTRSFSDNRQYAEVRQFSLASLWGVPVLVGSTRFQHTAETVTASPESFQYYRDGDDLFGGLRSGQFIFFGQVTIPQPSEDEDEDAAEDVDDFLGPCDVDWDPCALTPQNIRVEVNAPTASPGRSFTSKEQLVQPDAGCWRIVFENIRVVTKTNVLLWREYESTLNGRAGVVCVPVYEAILSSVAVVATCSGGASVGAVYVDIAQTAGAAIVEGQHFTAGDRLYRIKTVLSVLAGITTVKVWPPLREDIAASASLDFNTPTCRCRLATDDQMNIRLELLKFAQPSVTFLEDV